jgi:hypothetical protein
MRKRARVPGTFRLTPASPEFIAATFARCLSAPCYWCGSTAIAEVPHEDLELDERGTRLVCAECGDERGFISAGFLAG